MAESERFEIPLDYSEFEHENGLSKHEKKEILEFISKHNAITSEQEYFEIEEMIIEACNTRDFEYLEILLNSQIEIDNIIYKINKKNKTASLFKIYGYFENFTVPRSIKQGTQKYLVTSIISSGSESYKDIKNLKFDENSAVRTIYDCAFYSSSIESLYIPDSLTELKDGWCQEMNFLTKIIISKDNNRFCFKDNQILIGKTNDKSDFDILLYGRRDIEEIHIPSNIKIISPYAFYMCENLQKIEIPKNSKLQTIGRFAFAHIYAESIYIPSTVIQIGMGAFCASKFQQIEISSNSKLQIIERSTFEFCLFESILIPATVTKICNSAFSYCSNLQKVEFATNSNLQIIGNRAFSSTDIKSINIPATVTKIGYGAFTNCYNLQNVEIPTNSRLKIIENDAFRETKIESIYIPEDVTKLGETFCSETKQLTKIIISPKNKRFSYIDDKYLVGKTKNTSNVFDVILFARNDIVEAKIPFNIKIIHSKAFYSCKKLKKVIFSENSSLQKIDLHAFYLCGITKISIPASVLEIGVRAFDCCELLKKVEFPENSQLQKIGNDAFQLTGITSICIPENVLEIGENAFYADDLLLFELPENSKLEYFDLSIFGDNQNVIVYIPLAFILKRVGKTI